MCRASFTRRIRLLDRDQAIAGLRRVKQDWEIAAGGDLVQVRGSVWFLLVDCARAIGLDENDQQQAFGDNSEAGI